MTQYLNTSRLKFSVVFNKGSSFPFYGIIWYLSILVNHTFPFILVKMIFSDLSKACLRGTQAQKPGIEWMKIQNMRIYMVWKFKLFVRPKQICRTHETSHRGMCDFQDWALSRTCSLRDLMPELCLLSNISSSHCWIHHLTGCLLSLLLSPQLVVRPCFPFLKTWTEIP